MKSIFEHIEDAKGRPHHEKQRIALGSAAVLTCLIAVVWLGTNVATGAFALKPSSFADSSGGVDVVSPEASSGATSQLAGAAAATSADASAPARIEIIDSATSSTLAGKKADQTVIPF